MVKYNGVLIKATDIGLCGIESYKGSGEEREHGKCHY